MKIKYGYLHGVLAIFRIALVGLIIGSLVSVNPVYAVANNGETNKGYSSVTFAINSVVPGVGVYDDAAVGWTYTGAWTAITDAPGATNNTQHRSGTVGDKASFVFSGTQFILKYTQNTNRGNVGVYVDGNLITTFSQYGVIQWQTTYTSPIFASGTHTVEFRNAGGGTYVDIDSIEIP